MQYRAANALHVRSCDLPQKCLPHDLDSPPFKALVESIREHGILTPVQVDRNSVIVYGHYRYWAALRAGRKMIPIEVV